LRSRIKIAAGLSGAITAGVLVFACWATPNASGGYELRSAFTACPIPSSYLAQTESNSNRCASGRTPESYGRAADRHSVSAPALTFSLLERARITRLTFEIASSHRTRPPPLFSFCA
jgi:hypothetical protein